MSEAGKGFVLTPSRLGKPPSDDNGAAKPTIFTGLKQSKLGILADSKLSVLSTQSNTQAEAKPSEEIVKPPTFRFTPLTKEENTENTNLFLGKDPPSDGKKEEGSKIVFGQNLSSRVEGKSVFGENLSEKAIVPENKEEENEKKDSTKETSELLFSSVSADQKQPEEEKKTLSESAAEYTESHSIKRKYDEVEVITGEEEEQNVVQCNVKLYLFNTDTKNWTERGRGLLRLNDASISTPGHLRSRLVMRTHGSLRVILNTKLWAEMVCEKVNEKNIRISAWDEDVIRIFLLTASPKDADKLFLALESRINQLKNDKDAEGEPSPKKKPADPDAIE